MNLHDDSLTSRDRPATLEGEFNTNYGMLMTGAAVDAIPMMRSSSPSSATSSKASASAASKAGQVHVS